MGVNWIKYANCRRCIRNLPACVGTCNHESHLVVRCCCLMAMLLLLLLLAMRLILAKTCQLTSCLLLVVVWPLAPVARRLHLPQWERETKTELTELTETGDGDGDRDCDWPELAMRLCVFWGVCLCCLPTCNNMRHAPFELALSLAGTAAYSSAKCLHDCLHNCLIAGQISNVSLASHTCAASKQESERERERERGRTVW